jgi:hypothetical protein
VTFRLRLSDALSACLSCGGLAEVRVVELSQIDRAALTDWASYIRSFPPGGRARSKTQTCRKRAKTGNRPFMGCRHCGQGSGGMDSLSSNINEIYANPWALVLIQIKVPRKIHRRPHAKGQIACRCITLPTWRPARRASILWRTSGRAGRSTGASYAGKLKVVGVHQANGAFASSPGSLR